MRLNSVKHQIEKLHHDYFESFVTNFQHIVNQSSITYNTSNHKENLDDFMESFNINSFKIGPDFSIIREKYINFYSFKYFCEILNIKDNAIIQEIEMHSKRCRDIKWIEYNVLRLYDREISMLDFIEDCLKYQGAYSIALRYIYIMLLSFMDLKVVLISDAQTIADIFS